MASSQDLTTFIALFHHRDHTAAAIRDLEAKGFASSAMTVINGTDGRDDRDEAAMGAGRTSTATGTTTGTATATNDSYGDGYGYGTGADLSSIGVPERDRKRLQDGLDKGGTVLMLEGEGTRAEEIDTIFHKYAEKIDETDNDLNAAPLAAAALPVAAAKPVAAPARTDVLTGDSAVIPVVAEELVVGKREVDRGGVRVFSRVVEEPVQASVVLHEEHVVVDRRPVDRAVTEADLRGGDKVVELTETREEAVVGKSARVVEEVLIGKQASDRSETIRDSVRHTEVDVEEIDATTTADKRSTDKF